MLKDEYDFGQAFAQELCEQFGQVLPVKKPYPGIPGDWMDKMELANICDPNEDQFWKGYNEWYG